MHLKLPQVLFLEFYLNWLQYFQKWLQELHRGYLFLGLY